MIRPLRGSGQKICPIRKALNYKRQQEDSLPFRCRKRSVRPGLTAGVSACRRIQAARHSAAINSNPAYRREDGGDAIEEII